MPDFLPLVGSPKDKEEAQMVWPLRHSYWWAPRRALMTTGFGLLILGILGFFFDWDSNENVIYMDPAKSIISIISGLILYWIGEVWSASWKRKVVGLLTIVSLALGIIGLIFGSNQSENLGITNINSPLESIIWLCVGIWSAITIFWPRRMFDYEWATGTSSGVRSSG